MPFGDLRQFIDAVAEIGELTEIKGASTELEIGAITEYSTRSKGDRCPAILFDEIPSYPRGYRILTNIINCPSRAALALGLPHDVPKTRMVKLLKEKLAKYTPLSPKMVDSGPVQENVLKRDELDVNIFPSPLWHELDGGRYLGTGCAVITQDRDEGWVNAGCYRVQVHDRKTLGVYMSPGRHGYMHMSKYWSRGENAPVAVAAGIDTGLFIAASHSVPYGSSEYDFAGWINGTPVQLIEGEHTGIPIPASAEIVIEGEIPPPTKESHIEGPFGEWTGYYAHGAKEEPLIKVKSVMFRDSPIISGAPPLKPPYGTIGIPIGCASLWEELERMGIPNIVGIWQYSGSGSGGSGKPVIVISIKQSYIGHAKQVGLAACSAKSGAYFGRFVIVVEEDIDPSNTEDVLWAMAMRCDPADSIDIVKNCRTSLLDPRISPEKREKGILSTGRAVIDACKPYEWKDQFAKVNLMSKELEEKTGKKWGRALEAGRK